MERRKFKRALSSNIPKRLVSSRQNNSRYPVGRVTRKNLSPLQRFERFKKIQEKVTQSKLKDNNKSEKKNLRVTFAEMDTEGPVVNGSHESDIENNEEKILKPRKPVEQQKPVLQNGDNENGSVSETTDNDNIENGYDEELENENANENLKINMHQPNIQDKKESTPIKSMKKDSRGGTPKVETPSKRELRRREPTPRLESPVKRVGRSARTSSKNTPEKNLSFKKETKEQQKESVDLTEEDANDELSDDGEVNEKRVDQSQTEFDDSVQVIEEIKKDITIISVNESSENVEVEPQRKSIFSVFRRSPRSSSSIDMKDTCEASSSSPSVICIDTVSPSSGDYSFSNKEIRGRKPINSFARFPGRNVSITSSDTSQKRKADDSIFGDEERKRFAGETESGSERSPGWFFFSQSFNRSWSPVQEKSPVRKSPLESSTPFHRMNEQDSMAVNYDENTKLTLDESVYTQAAAGPQEEEVTKPHQPNKWCIVM